MYVVALRKCAHPKHHLSYFQYYVHLVHFESIVDTKRGSTSIGGVYMSDTNCNLRHSFLVRLQVTKQVYSVFEMKLFSLLDAYASP